MSQLKPNKAEDNPFNLIRGSWYRERCVYEVEEVYRSLHESPVESHTSVIDTGFEKGRRNRNHIRRQGIVRAPEGEDRLSTGESVQRKGAITAATSGTCESLLLLLHSTIWTESFKTCNMHRSWLHLTFSLTSSQSTPPSCLLSLLPPPPSLLQSIRRPQVNSCVSI